MNLGREQCCRVKVLNVIYLHNDKLHVTGNAPECALNVTLQLANDTAYKMYQLTLVCDSSSAVEAELK